MSAQSQERCQIEKTSEEIKELSWRGRRTELSKDKRLICDIQEDQRRKQEMRETGMYVEKL